ncbi:hypothetical protein LAZ67_3002507 [Cordylochernes scorpioides]|uniref:Transposase n=1 Tax=Cordylochernes scorpioides TaxID=51811 RepID=A0ABY6K9L1_9ARAC|nr:hypothetical protein LAZ67_3002507 [Cordylochernes scorpioides]
MKDVYGDKCLSQNRIFEWVRKYKSGIECLDDAPRPGATVKCSKIITKHLKYRNIFTRWVPRLLTKEMKEKCLSARKELLERYKIEEWHHRDSPTPMKPRITVSAGKVLLTIFWQSKGCNSKDYLPKGQIGFSELLEKKNKVNNSFQKAWFAEKRGMTFKTNDEVKNAVHGWLAQHTQDFFLIGNLQAI